MMRRSPCYVYRYDDPALPIDPEIISMPWDIVNRYRPFEYERDARLSSEARACFVYLEG